MDAISGQQLPQRTLRVLAVLMALIVFAPFAFAAAVAPTGVTRIPAAILAVVVLVWILARARRIDLSITADRVSIQNLWRSYTFGWNEVEVVGKGSIMGTPAIAFVLKDGRVCSAQASAYTRHLRTVSFAIARTYAPNGVRFLDSGLT